MVGAGAAGLSAATWLALAGLEVVVLEAEQTIGGRLRTDEHGAWRLDRGFHIVVGGYGELRRLVPPWRLGLAELFAGLVILDAEGRAHVLADPRRVPATLRATAMEVGQRMRGGVSVAQLARRARSANATLGDWLDVLPARMREEVVGPLCRGVFAAPELDVSLPVARRVLRGLLRGPLGLPQGGIAQLAQRLARPVAGRVSVGARVVEVATGLVRLEGGEELRADEVVLAVGPEEASRLLGVPYEAAVRWRAQGWAHLLAEELPLSLPAVAVAPLASPVWTVLATSLVDPLRAPIGETGTLVTVSFDPRLPPGELPAALAGLVPGLADARVLAAGVVERALPHAARVPAARAARGIVLAGDWTATPSLDGALASGRVAAELIMRAREARRRSEP